MRKSITVFIIISITFFLVSGTGLPFFKDKPVYAQQIQDKSLSRQLRLGTDNLLTLPSLPKLLYGNGQNATIDQEFILLGNNPKVPGQHNVAVSNPDYGLREPVPALRVGERFVINSTVDADIKYTSAAVILTPTTSPFPPTNKSISGIDPEFDMTFSTPIKLGAYTGGSGSFVIPQTASPGYYLLYAYLQYPAQNMTAVYNTVMQITSNATGTSSSSSPPPSPTEQPIQ
jgi:hypothetical protein